MKKVEVNPDNYLPLDYNGYSVIKGYIAIHDANYVKELERETKNYLVLYRIRDTFYLVHISVKNSIKNVEGWIIEAKEDVYEYLLKLRQFVKILGGIHSAEGIDELAKKIGVWERTDEYLDTAYCIDSAISRICDSFNIFDQISYDEYKEYCKKMDRKND